MRARGQILTGSLVLVVCGVLLAAAAGQAQATGLSDAGPGREKAALERSDLSLMGSEPVWETAASGEPVDPPAARGGERKHPMLAFLMSAILPGWGELYTGHTARARAFMSTETGVWVGYAAFRIQEDMRTDDYEEYAQTFADVREGASGDYYQDIADYIRSEGEDSYNEAVRAEARSLYPDDLEAQKQYFEENGYSGAQAWDWGDTDLLEHYRDLRHDAAVSSRNAFYMTGLAVLNRALSAIDSAWMARRHNAGMSGTPPARLSIAPDLTDGTVGGRLALEVQF